MELAVRVRCVSRLQLIVHCPDVVSISDGGPLLVVEFAKTVATAVGDVDKLGNCFRSFWSDATRMYTGN